MAIKSVNLSKLNKKLKENLFGEIHILKDLHHPHIVSLIDCKESSTHIHLVMEYCQLGDLSHFIKRRDTLGRISYTADMVKKYPHPPAGGLNEVVVRHFLQQLSSALEFLRNGNLIHRDVKPQNLLLNPSPLYYSKARPEMMPFAPNENSLIPIAGVESLPMLKIADFGFARSLPATSLAETLCGSPLYMAPEILRYEKYDAKADLWSVGTVLYEMMVGKPPFRASNYVELLRKIEKGEDRIKFPEDAILSEPMKKLIRGLLKRNPVERMGFSDFFDNPVIKDEIPGLVGEDRPKKQIEQQPGPSKTESPRRQGSVSNENRPQEKEQRTRREINTYSSSVPQDNPSRSPRTTDPRPISQNSRPQSYTPLRPVTAQRRATDNESEGAEVFHDAEERAPQTRRPSMPSHFTAPARQELHAGNVGSNATGNSAPQQNGSKSSSPNPSEPKDSNLARAVRRSENRVSRELIEARERAAQDVAFERDYIIVEKKAVEVNAFADELAASPRIHGDRQVQQEKAGAMTRRATTGVTPISTAGANVTPSRAIQIASGRRPDQNRQNSYERRQRSSTSTSSAISKAINLASGRLFNFGISPPLSLGRTGPSPPLYSPFPAYPTNHGSMLMISDGSKPGAAADEDSKAIHVIEEAATRSDVVYGFAEVKYKQLIPIAPSVEHGLGLRQAGIPEHDEYQPNLEEDNGLTVDAVVTLSEEALVLYVKALSLLAKSMDIAGAWWSRKSRGEVYEDSTGTRTPRDPAQNIAVGNRVNNVVQWVRGRFNEVLEKAEFVRLKLIEAQKRLPPDHPSHPNNHPSASTSSAGLGTSGENVIVSPGVTAEKLMYQRAVEMSRSAAVNELVCEDLQGCEIAYVTAIRMLEAVLEIDEELLPKKAISEKDGPPADVQPDDFNPVNPDDRESVTKSKLAKHSTCNSMLLTASPVISGIRTRLTALRKKLHVIAKRNTSTAPPAPTKPPTNGPANVQIANTSGTSPQS